MVYPVAKFDIIELRDGVRANDEPYPCTLMSDANIHTRRYFVCFKATLKKAKWQFFGCIAVNKYGLKLYRIGR
jgi:hypothetical protein